MGLLFWYGAVKPGATASGPGEGTTATGKPTGAPRATRLEEARQRGTPPAKTTAQDQVRRNDGHRVPQTRTARATSAQPRHARRCQATPSQLRSARHEHPPLPEEPENWRRSREAETRKRPRSSSKAETRPRDMTPRAGSSGADQAAGAAAPRTGSSRDKMQAGTHGRGNRVRYKQEEPPPPQTGSARDKWRQTPRNGTSEAEQAAGATGGGSSRRSCRRPGLDQPGTSGGGRPGMEHPGRSKQQEQPAEDQAGGAAGGPDWISQGQVAADAPDWNIRGGASSRSSRERYKQEEPPPPRTASSRDTWRRTPRTGASGAEQAAGATGGGSTRRSCRHPGLDHPATSGDRRPRLEHPGRSKQQEQPGEVQAGGAAATPDWIIQGQVAADAPDWNIRGGASSRSNWERYKQEEPPPPRTASSRDKWRRTPRTGTSGAEQAAGATGRGTSRRSRRHPGLHHPGTSGGGRPGLEHPGRSKQQEQPAEDQAGGASATPDWIIQQQVATDAPDWNIWGGASSRSNRMRYKQEEPPPPRTGSSRDKWRRTPRTGTSGAEQAAAGTG